MIDPLSLAAKFVKGEYVVDVGDATWRAAFTYIVRYRDYLKFDQAAVHLVWTENGGHLRGKIRDDPLILRVLESALPRYRGGDMILYRGECRFLFDRKQIGFCWTPRRDVAECYARGLNAIESGGVLLKASVPAAAILAGPHSHSSGPLGESEYTCDATKITHAEVLGLFPPPA
jgi:hypothetical protein